MASSQVGNRSGAIDCRQVSAANAQTTLADVANVPHKSPDAAGFDGLLYRVWPVFSNPRDESRLDEKGEGWENQKPEKAVSYSPDRQLHSFTYSQALEQSSGASCCRGFLHP
jgi:hypothetical protein